jgi:hypothetical protein
MAQMYTFPPGTNRGVPGPVSRPGTGGKVPAVSIDTFFFFFFEVIADAVVSALLAIGRRRREAAAAGIDAISRWTEPLWSPAGGELAWRARTDAALSCGDFEYAFHQAVAHYAAGAVDRHDWTD